MTARHGRKVHFMGGEHVRRTACGRAVLSPEATTVQWSADPKAVTCAACRRTMGLYGNGAVPLVTAEAPVVMVGLTAAQVTLIRSLATLEQESVPEYVADRIMTEAQAAEYHAELEALDRLVALAR